MKIDFDKPVQTRDGREVRIYTTEGKTKHYPVIGELCSDGNWHVRTWTSGGTDIRWSSSTVVGLKDEGGDLINVPEKHTVWINFYRGAASLSIHHADKASADEAVTEGRIACIEVTFTEGEGL